MSHPRFLFTARVVPANAGGVAGIAWRLVGGNNHELGRSASPFGDLRGCVDAVHLLQDHLVDLEAELDTAESTGQWGWRLLDDGVPLAISGRWYRRERECEYNLTQFLAAAPDAGIAEVVGGQPPRRELLRPEFVLPHLQPVDVEHLVPAEPDPALTQDLPADRVDELTEAS